MTVGWGLAIGLALAWLGAGIYLVYLGKHGRL